MTIDEFFGDFDECDYAASIAHLKEHQLRAEHDKIRKKVVAAQSAIGASGLSLFHTAGISLLGAGIGWRKQNYNSKKQSICEARMCREGWPLEEMRTRDFLMAVGPSAAASVLLPGAEHVAGHLISHAAGHGAAQFTSHHVADTLASAAHHPEQFVHAVSDGVGSQMHAVGQGLMGHATNLVPIDAVAQNTPQFLGNIAGQGLANAAEMAGVHSATRAATEKGAKVFISAKQARRSGVSSRVTQRADTPKVVKVATSPATQNILGSTTQVIMDVSPPELANSFTSNPSAPLQLANIRMFVFFFLAPAINDILGLGPLWTITLLANLYALLTNDRKRLFWTWMYLSWPTIVASMFDSRVLWAAISAWKFVTAVRLVTKHITTPGVFACVALPLLFCTSNYLREVITAFCWLSIITAMIQFDFTRHSFDRKSPDYIQWYNLRRPEYITTFICLIMASLELGNKYRSIWFGAKVAGLSISAVQGISWERKGRRARLVIFTPHDNSISGKVYGYTDGVNKVGATNEDGIGWHYNPVSGYEFLDSTHLSDSDIKDQGTLQLSKDTDI